MAFSIWFWENTYLHDKSWCNNGWYTQFHEGTLQENEIGYKIIKMNATSSSSKSCFTKTILRQ